MLGLVCSMLAFSTKSQVPQRVLQLRGGMELGPLTPGNFNGVLQVAAAITAASAISEKYANIGETTLTKTFKGDVFNTNLIISMVTGVVSTAVYSAGASSFDSLQLTAALWLLSTLVKFKDSGFDVSTLTDMSTALEKGITIAAAVLAFA
eukprot:jgi/Chrpa1/14029/Chrysochromulina_OHIO_Genome00000103-RA